MAGHSLKQSQSSVQLKELGGEKHRVQDSM